MKNLPELIPQKKKILIVEDSSTQRIKLRYLLENEGFNVFDVCNGNDGLSAARENSFDLIVTDIIMPGMNGFEFCKAIRSEKNSKDLKVIMLTSLSDPKDVIRGLEAGADNFIKKPYEEKHLVEQIRRLLLTAEVRNEKKRPAGATIQYQGKEFFLNSETLQVLDVLFSAYNDSTYQLKDSFELNVFDSKILIVEDSQTQLERIQFCLKDQGYRVKTATNGLEGLAKLDEESFDLIISDVNMPEMNGMDFCKAVRKKENLNRIPIILMTAATDPLDVISGLEAGATNFLRKPFDDEYIITRIRNLLVSQKLAEATNQGRGIDIIFAGKSFTINADRVQMLDLLLSSYDNAVKQNKELAKTHEQLRELNNQLEMRVEERTKALKMEIEERKAAQLEKESVANLPAENPDVVLRLDSEGTILFANPPGQLFIEALNCQVGDKGPEKMCEMVISILQTGICQTFEMEDHEAFMEFRAVPIKSQGYVNLYGRDITAKKIAEKEKDLLQSQLAQAQKMESIGRLAGGVAHDFNNFLGVILGNVEALMEEPNLEAQQKEMLKEILNASYQSVDLTKQLLTFARRQVIAPKIIDLNQATDVSLKMLKRIIGENIQLNWHPAANLWKIKMDSVQINQILANLCVNARDAIGETGEINISTANVDFDAADSDNSNMFRTGSYVLLKVNDNGSGMDEQTLKKIFEPFFTTKEAGKGTGLGLATVFGIVEQNGGFIDVLSKPEQGTTFKIFFPRSEQEIDTKPETGKAKESTASETILIVEDEESLLKVGVFMLTRKGYNVLSASTPIKALEIAKTFPDPIHLLMTDIVMPDMDGRTLWEKLRVVRPETKCLFVSGYVPESLDKVTPTNNVKNFLQKPYTLKMLNDKIREILNESQA